MTTKMMGMIPDMALSLNSCGRGGAVEVVVTMGRVYGCLCLLCVCVQCVVCDSKTCIVCISQGEGVVELHKRRNTRGVLVCVCVCMCVFLVKKNKKKKTRVLSVLSLVCLVLICG